MEEQVAAERARRLQYEEPVTPKPRPRQRQKPRKKFKITPELFDTTNIEEENDESINQLVKHVT